jgi:hypothetical protein
MTTLLEEGLQAIRTQPPERQDLAGELLLTIARQGETGIRLTPAQLAEVRLAAEEADRGEYATDQEMTELWRAAQ